MAAEKLSAIKVAKVTKPGRYGDGKGLYLQVAKGGSKSWVLRYERQGRERWAGLGSLDHLSLAEARERARAARKALRLEGIDPIEARKAERTSRRIEAASAVTFADAAERMMASHSAGWRNAKHRQQWANTLATYAYPVFGALPVAAIDTALVLKALEAIWREKPETANRVRGRIAQVIDWAKARGLRNGENPAAWRGHLDRLLPSHRKLKTVRHLAAMPYRELPEFMGELRGREGVAARALEFCVLTATRSAEVIGATWAEIDLEAAVWTIPAARMKANREHRVPLSARAVELLAALPRERDNPHIFMGGRAGKPLSDTAMWALVRDMRPGFVPHGFRSSFRDWVAETTAYPRELAETALGHVVGSAVERAYQRGDYFEKRRRLMSEWAAYCASPPRSSAVIPIRA